MASNTLNPTVANILSSLHIKGASVEGGASKAGFVPVLDEHGKLKVSTIPVEAISEMELDVPALNVAFVDASTTSETRTGSIASPFASLSEAAAYEYETGKYFTDFVIVAGSYGDEEVGIRHTTSGKIRIFGLGSVEFTTLKFFGYKPGSIFELDNITVASQLNFAGSATTVSATFTGSGSIHSILLSEDEAALSLYVGADFSIGSVSPTENITVSYLSGSSRVANNSTTVAGATVTDALDSLRAIKIKIPKFTADSTGIHADSSSYEDISVPPGGDTYLIVGLGTTLVAAVNGTFHKDGDSPSYNEVTATAVKAATADLTTVNVKYLGIKDNSNNKMGIRLVNEFLDVVIV